MDYSRAVADRTAKLLHAVGGEALVLRELLDVRAADTQVPGTAAKSPASDEQIGVWLKRADAGGIAYVRQSNRTGEWRSAHERWADVEVIPSKGARRRVILLGESAARGYFYDPVYTPATVLETLLARHLPEGAEVIDLAANDLSSAELETLLRKVPALAPDAIVIFAGNNWAQAILRRTIEDVGTRSSAAAALRHEGVSGLKRLLEDRLLRSVIERTQMLPLLLQRMGIPAVVVVPEFNLADWADHASSNAPWLAQGENRRWWDHYLQAQRALQEKALQRAAKHAKQMIALDGGLTHNGLQILGTELAAAGEHEQARSALERARDARVWDVANLSPRCSASIQDGLRRAASRTVQVVDLPAVFARLNGNRLPDRAMFMDYCHLSAPAIAVAMACTARALVPQIDLPPDDVIREDATLLPPPEVEGTAHLLAAIHNAHWGQRDDIVRHHLRAAGKSIEMIETLRLVFEMQGRRVPAWMTSAAGTVTATPNSLISRYFMGYSKGRHFDERLLNLIAATLEEGGDASASQRLETIRLAEWSVQSSTARVDLLDTVWTQIADQCPAKHEEVRGGGAEGQVRGWHRAYTPLSRFPLVSNSRSARGMRIQLTCRRAAFFEPEGECVLRLNHMDIESFVLSRSWRVHHFELPAHLIRRGVNELELMWPAGQWQSTAAVEAAATQMESGRLAELSPAFADILDFWLYQQS